MTSLRQAYRGLRNRLTGRDPRMRRLFQDISVLRKQLSGGVRPDRELHWLLIYTFPNGGSTAFSDLLGSSSRACRLAGNSEGQWLIPEIADRSQRMLEKPLVSGRKLRHVWISRARAVAPRGRRVVIEKSPDSIFRWRHIEASLGGMRQTTVVFVREPLPTIASWMKRYDWIESAKMWSGFLQMPAETREDGLRILARLYLRRARALLERRESADLFLSYEALCEDPAPWIRQIIFHEPLLDDVDPDARLSVKDYEAQPLRNMNAANEALLTEEDRRILLDELARDPEPIRAMGYRLGAPAAAPAATLV